MEYATSYGLEIKELKADSNEAIIDNLRKASEGAKYAIDENGETEESSKWYDHEKDLIEFSKRYPSKVFILSGEGEETGDIWKSYFVNGKVQTEKAEIQVAKFDPAKLK